MPASLTAIDCGHTALLASTAKELRELADKIEAGRASTVVAICICDATFEYHSNVSKVETIAMSALLHDWALERMKT